MKIEILPKTKFNIILDRLQVRGGLFCLRQDLNPETPLIDPFIQIEYLGIIEMRIRQQGSFGGHY